MSDLVFWQEPGNNYVRVGELRSVDRELIPNGGGFRRRYETTGTVKRWGSVETVNAELLRRVT